MAALHQRVAVLEMTKHEFLDASYRRERTTFADGTTVTVDWNTNTFVINPVLTNKSRVRAKGFGACSAGEATFQRRADSG